MTHITSGPPVVTRVRFSHCWALIATSRKGLCDISLTGKIYRCSNAICRILQNMEEQYQFQPNLRVFWPMFCSTKLNQCSRSPKSADIPWDSFQRRGGRGADSAIALPLFGYIYYYLRACPRIIGDKVQMRRFNVLFGLHLEERLYSYTDNLRFFRG